jgi:hypothetical protein
MMTTLKVAEIAMGAHARAAMDRPITPGELNGALAPDERAKLEAPAWMVEELHLQLYQALDCAARARVDRSRHQHWTNEYATADRDYCAHLAEASRIERHMADAGVEPDKVLRAMLKREGFL